MDLTKYVWYRLMFDMGRTYSIRVSNNKIDRIKIRKPYSHVCYCLESNVDFPVINSMRLMKNDRLNKLLGCAGKTKAQQIMTKANIKY